MKPTISKDTRDRILGGELWKDDGVRLLAIIDEQERRLAKLMDPELLEQMAALEHDRWSNWEDYRETTLRRSDRRGPSDEETHEERWHRQRNTEYADLSEKEKESDRVEARKTRDLIAKALGLLP